MKRLPLQFCLYEKLNSKQRENYNAAKLSALLSDYGYSCIRLSDDWSGADFIAIHTCGDVYRIQLKGRFGFWKRYQGKDLFMAFRDREEWYIYPHDELLAEFLEHYELTESWNRGGFSYPGLSLERTKPLEPYRVPTRIG